MVLRQCRPGSQVAAARAGRFGWGGCNRDCADVKAVIAGRVRPAAGLVAQHHEFAAKPRIAGPSFKVTDPGMVRALMVGLIRAHGPDVRLSNYE